MFPSSPTIFPLQCFQLCSFPLELLPPSGAEGKKLLQPLHILFEFSSPILYRIIVQGPYKIVEENKWFSFTLKGL